MMLKKDQIILFPRVIEAKSFWMRMKGLLGYSNLSPDTTMWIKRCNSIHTFFMKFNIDVVFVNKNLKVCAVYSNIKPGRVIFPVWSASSVFEMTTGRASNIMIGDQLHVDD